MCTTEIMVFFSKPKKKTATKKDCFNKAIREKKGVLTRMICSSARNNSMPFYDGFMIIIFKKNGYTFPWQRRASLDYIARCESMKVSFGKRKPYLSTVVRLLIRAGHSDIRDA